MLQTLALLHTEAFINGEWCEADNEKTFSVFNPADGGLIADIPDMGQAETERAIEAAHTAFLKWRNVTAEERSQLLFKVHREIERRRKDLETLLTLEQGKPLSQAQGEVQVTLNNLWAAAEEARRVHGYTLQSPEPTKRYFTVRQPVGVVAVITPWNYPLLLAAQRCFAAIAAACTVVLKPAQDTPLTALALAEILESVGLPKGVLNVVTCEDPTVVGRVLCEHDLIKKVCFTGSTRVGKILQQQCANTVKRVSLELGGNCPMIVFDDANIDAAVLEGVGLKTENSGQMCININRFLVQKNVFEEFVEKFVKRYSSLRLGRGLDDLEQGPLVYERGVKKIEDLVQDALKQGAKLLCGGQRWKPNSLFFEPTVLINMTTKMRMYKEEIFGPVAAIYSFDTEDEAIRMANDTEYGLAAYFFTQNQARTWRVMEALEAGTVRANTTDGSTTYLPFGGFKQSGIGREGGILNCLDEYCEIKSFTLA